jgi:hypothetical protein
MKAKIKPGQLALLILLVLFSLVVITGCRNKLKAGTDSETGCDLTTKGGLYNCQKDDCTGKCVLQIKKPGKDWKDIPGGNVNPKDVPSEDKIRCVCRDIPKKTD